MPLILSKTLVKKETTLSATLSIPPDFFTSSLKKGRIFFIKESATSTRRFLNFLNGETMSAFEAFTIFF